LIGSEPLAVFGDLCNYVCMI